MSALDDGVFLGIDIGSSSAKAVAVDPAGQLVSAVGHAAFTVERPTAGGWEIDPLHLFEASCEAVRELPEEVRRATRAVAVTGQMCGLVPLRKDRQPADHCLPIFDDRSVAESRELEGRFGDHLRQHAANGALPVYTLPKLLWMRRHRPESFERTDLVVLPKDYVRGRLTGEWVTEPTDASGTLAFDQHAAAWDEQLLAELDLPRAQWPPVVDSLSPAGTIGASAAGESGLPAGIPVAAGASDMAAVPVGVGATTVDDLVVSFGTAAHLISPVDSLTAAWPIQQYSSAVGATWFQFGAVYSGGVCAQWLVDLLGDPADFAIFDEAVDRPPGEQVLFMPYLAGAGAPHEVPEAGGAFLGLRLGHDRSDLARAVLYGLAFEVAAIHRIHDPAGTRRIHVTGGGTRLGPLVQVLADVLDREVLLSASPDAAGIGAAWIAGLSIDPARGARSPASPTVVAPKRDGVARLAELRPRYEDAARSVRELARR